MASFGVLDACLHRTFAVTKLTQCVLCLPGVPRGKALTSRQQLSNQLGQLLDLQRQSEQLKEKTATVLANRQPGGAIKSGVTSFVSPNFSQVCAVRYCICAYYAHTKCMYLTLSALKHSHKSAKSDAVSCVCSSGECMQEGCIVCI